MPKSSPFRYLLLIIPVILIVLAAIFFRKEMPRIAGLDALTPTATTDPYAEPTPEIIDSAIQKSVDQSIAELKAADPGFLLYNVLIDHVEYSADGNSAMVWLATLDPETGEVIAREPEIAIAEKNPEGQKGTADEWSIVLPFSEDYSKVVEGLPKGLLGEDFEQRFQTKYPEQKVVAKFGGYYLPWGGGQKKRVTWSISHASCSGNDCKYAFDFADGTMFPLLAAKGGTVFAAQWTCNNGSTGCTNYLILKDNSTNPVSYQIYYHMANGSLPSALRKPGAIVNQGTYIGNVDDTGASTANHLHFMVHTSSYGYWGTSVDITFKDVSINYDSVTKGGRPRTLTEANKYGGQGSTYYTSGNKAAKGPTGSISVPAEGASLTSRTVPVTATGTDDRGVTKAQLMAYYNNAWHDVGAPQTKVPFTLNLDLCSAGAEVPDGPISFALTLWDVEGNQSVGLQGLRGMVKNFSCTNTAPPPPCNPLSDQISIYSGTNYTGVCKTFNTGDYVNPASMKGFLGDDLESVLVGSNAQVTLWAKASYTSRGETLVTSDPDLGDNLINRNSTNSFKVRTHATAVTAPSIVSPTNGTSLTTDESITLFWANNGWADEFQAEISGNNGFVTRTSEWTQGHSWSIGGLPVGTYTWRVHARNNANHQTSGWVSASLTIKAATLSLGTAQTAPWQDTVENGINGWTKTGLWAQSTARSSSASHSWYYGETVNSVLQYVTGKTGVLTSPSIRVPAAGYYLRFVYRYNTEGSARYWDQRWVQVSMDGGPFTNVQQLYWDPENTWLQSPAIDLSAYANKNIRIRFYFHTLDAALNTGDGWYVDDIRVDQSGPATGCNEAVPNNTLSSASSISISQPASGDICAAGDVDYYKFSAKAGDRLTFDVDAKSIGSALDPVLTLINRDGRTVLAENDDEVALQVKDSRVYYVIPADGDYYLRIQAWDHPMAGGADFFYTIRIYNDNAAPSAQLNYPANGALLPNAPFNISVSGSDSNGSGIGHIVFYWHSHDWVSGTWQLIGEDWNGTDGWNYVFDPTKEAKGSLGAIYAQVYDGSGNKTGVASWKLRTDPAQPPPPIPTSSMIPLAATSNLNTVLLQWTANNVGPGIASFEVQVKENGGAWQNWSPPDGIKPTDRYAWFIGQAGSTYGFRMRVIDPMGNKEAWNDAPETSVELKGCTTGVDAAEADNSLSQAKSNEIDGDHLQHTFCGPMDQDWIKVDLAAGEMYYFNALPMTNAVAVVLTVYDSSGKSLAEQFPTQLGSPTALRWMAPVNGTFYLKARNLNPLIAGDGATYQLWVDQGLQVYVPMVIQ